MYLRCSWARQHLPEEGPAAVDPAAHRAHRDAERLADLLVREADHVTEHDGGTEVPGQALDRRLYVVGEDLGGQGLVGATRGRQYPVGVLGQQTLGAAPATTDVVEEGVRGDTAQPTRHRSRLVGLEPPAYPQQHLLHEVFRVLSVSREAVRHRVEEAPVAAGNLLPGGCPLTRHH